MIAQLTSTGAEHEEVILAIVAVLATAVAGLAYSVKAWSQAKQANDAVNHKEHGETRIFEQVREIRAKQEEFDRHWGNLPEDIDDAVGLVGLLHDMSKRIDNIDTALAAHVAWEQDMVNGKYAQG